MYIKRIKLINFRNYSSQDILLEPEINIFFGDNAQGKTNILEAIFLCSMGKSFRTKKDKEMIQLTKDFSSIEIEYAKSDREGKIKIDLTEKKEVYLNGVKLKKLSELLGNINTVIFTPDDIEILKSGPASRRRFLNMMISQLRPSYVHYLNKYSKALEQRNMYLRQIKYEGKPEELLDIWDEKLVEYGILVYQYREEFIQKIAKRIKDIHRNITNCGEDIKIKYISDVNNKENFIEELKKNRKLDIQKGFSSKGIHRDDFVIYINDRQVNIYGSQGQHRTAILSLKLSELEVIYDEIGEYPILLLDDFMSELDETRRRNFLDNIKETQVILTCTDKIHMQNMKYKIYKVESGKVKE